MKKKGRRLLSVDHKNEHKKPGGSGHEEQCQVEVMGEDPVALLIFDTHKLVRKLRDFGLEERYAEGISEALKNLEIGRDVTLHHDLELIRQEVRDLEFRVDARIQSVRSDLMVVKWMLSVIVVGIVGLIVKAFS
jgi:hypothetical protein